MLRRRSSTPPHALTVTPERAHDGIRLMPGHPPKPTHLKLLEGDLGRQPVHVRTPKPRRGVPRCPGHLSACAKCLWRALGRELDRMGVITMADGVALEMLCDAYAQYRDARDVVAIDGLTYKSTTKRGGVIVRARPEVAIAADAWRRTSSMLTAFGLSPASRAKLGVAGADGVDPMDAILNGKR